MPKYNVLSLFDGISCGRLALERAGIEINKYYTCEIDKYAIAVSDFNYPTNVKLGNVKDLDLPTMPKIDLLIGGSPCQSFSLAGNRLNFDDPRGQLFFDYLDILQTLKRRNPDMHFLLENVKMKADIRDAISEALGVEPVLVNSSLVSAQNRERYYWTSIKFEQPIDKGILLRDIIITGDVDRDKARAVIASGGRTTHREYLWKHQGNMVFDTEGFAQCVAVRGRNPDGGKYVQMAEPRIDGKNNTVTSVQKDNMLLEEPILISNIYGGFNESTVRVHTKKSPTIRTSAGGGHIPSVVDEAKLSQKAIEYMSRLRNGKPRWEYHKNPLDGKAACLTANMCKGVPYGVIKEFLRVLYPIECERLQTLPDNYTKYGVFDGEVKEVSKTQRYKMIGNGWTVDVLAHIFRNLNE